MLTGLQTKLRTLPFGGLRSCSGYLLASVSSFASKLQPTAPPWFQAELRAARRPRPTEVLRHQVLTIRRPGSIIFAVRAALSLRGDNSLEVFQWLPRRD